MIRHIIFGLLIALSCTQISAGEIQDRQVVKQHVHDLFAQKKYAELEKMYEHFKNDNVRTSSGVYALDEQFYAGFLWELYDTPPRFKAWEENKQALKQWMTQFPKSPAPRLIYAELLRAQGWAYRGESYSKDVEKKDWKPFHDHIKQSQQYLTSIKSLSKSDPHWYVKSLIVARDAGVDDDTYKKLFDEATTKFPNYYNIYYIAIQRNLPKWGGSTAALDNLAKVASEKTRAQDGDSLYARIYWAIEVNDEYQGSKLFSDTLVNWSRMKQGLDEIIVKYPSDWNITHYAYLACQAKDQPKAEEMFNKINVYVKENWQHHFHYLYCKAFAENKMTEYLKMLPDLDSDGWPLDPVVIKKRNESQAAFKAYEDATEEPYDAEWYNRSTPEERQKRLEEKTKHLKFLKDIYKAKNDDYYKTKIRLDLNLGNGKTSTE